jgi:hypothetical protein
VNGFFKIVTKIHAWRIRHLGNTRLTNDVVRTLLVGEETPASLFKQAVDSDSSLGFFFSHNVVAES